MASGAFALYVDQQAGGGPNAPISRVVPLPGGGEDRIHFDARQLTLAYDNVLPGSPGNVHVTGRFLPGGELIDVMLNAGACQMLEVPAEACAASLFVEPTGGPRGAVSALVEFSS